MQRRPVAATKNRQMASADLEDMEGGGATTSPGFGGSPYARQGSSASRVSSGGPDNLSLDSSPAVLLFADDSQGKGRKGSRFKRSSAFHFLTRFQADALRTYASIIIVITIIMYFFCSTTWSILLLVTSACCLDAIASLWLSRSVLSCDDGTAEMRAVSDPIREGAEGFLKVQYTAIAKFAVPLSALIVFSYQFRPSLEGDDGVSLISNTLLGIVAATGFMAGAVCSAISGYISMWVAAQSNFRVASAARRTYGEALVVCFQGGAFSAVLNLTLCITGVTSLYMTLHFIFVHLGFGLSTTDIPMLLVGYGFGASFVALFMQLGGGIYTKAADVGADMVGKIEQNIPEDDPRNPATIADLVGDMVGDCVGSSADVFESVAAEIIGAMILGSTVATESNMPPNVAAKFVFFPLVVHAMDVVVSTAGISFVGVTKDTANADPMKALQR